MPICFILPEFQCLAHELKRCGDAVGTFGQVGVMRLVDRILGVVDCQVLSDFKCTLRTTRNTCTQTLAEYFIYNSSLSIDHF